MFRRNSYHFGRSRAFLARLGITSDAMRIDADLRRCVAFLGFGVGRDDFQPIGTCFFIHYDEVQYLVTAMHVAVGIGDSPFCIRTNRLDGDAQSYMTDPVTDGITWFCRPDADIAVLPFV